MTAPVAEVGSRGATKPFSHVDKLLIPTYDIPMLRDDGNEMSLPARHAWNPLDYRYRYRYSYSNTVRFTECSGTSSANTSGNHRERFQFQMVGGHCFAQGGVDVVLAKTRRTTTTEASWSDVSLCFTVSSGLRTLPGYHRSMTSTIIQ
jgi:hypothetical protein